MLVLESQVTLDCLVHGCVKVVRIYQFDQGRLNILACFVIIDHVRSWKGTFNYISKDVVVLVSHIRSSWSHRVKMHHIIIDRDLTFTIIVAVMRTT